MNLDAFLWGRRTAHDVKAVETILGAARSSRGAAETLDEMIARRVAFLTDYQNAGLCRELSRIRRQVRQGARRTRAAELDRAHRGGGALSLQAHGLQGRV